MADLFTRLAARNTDRATALRPLPAATRAARPTARDSDAEIPTPTADTPRLDNRTDHRHENTDPTPVPQRSADPDDANQAGGAPPKPEPDNKHGPDSATTQRTQHPAPGEHRQKGGASSTPTTLTEVIAALDAGAVVDTPHTTPSPVHPITTATPAPATRRSPRRSERDGSRQPSVVTVTIGELVVRGTVGEPAGRQPEPSPPAAPPHSPPRDLSLHDYLRGSRVPR
jgi:hypothetical protein